MMRVETLIKEAVRKHVPRRTFTQLMNEFKPISMDSYGLRKVKMKHHDGW